MSLRIGLVGCGVIGTALARFIQKELGGKARINYLRDQDPEAEKRLAKILKLRHPQLSLKQLVQKSDFVIETASVDCVRELVPLSIRLKKPTLLLSGGGLADEPSLLKKILSSSVPFYLPSGAVAGLDGLLAAREAGLKKVRLITSKSLDSLRGAPFFKKFPEKFQLKKRSAVIFEGSMKKAIEYFPKNLNVSALLALAGLGPQKTRVRVVVFKKLPYNIHAIEIVSKAGKIVLSTQNLPHLQNPRTSALAIYSAQALLRKLFSPLSLGT
jgi:aspartate dehydrogenase